MHELIEAGAVMFSDDGSCVRNAEVMRRAFLYASPFDALLSQHCEEHSITEGFDMHDGAIAARLGLRGYPSVAEEVIIARDILLAEACGNRRYHISHLSTRGGLRLLRLAKAWGLRVSAEVTPHHFTLTHEAADGYNTNAKMNPPLRERDDVEAIIEALADGTIDAIATDHAPHTVEEKQQPFPLAPNGIIGLETAVGLALTELYHRRGLPLRRIVELMSVGPRRVLGLEQPRIAPGAPAVLTIVALDEEWTVEPERFRSTARNTPFVHWQLRGKPALFSTTACCGGASYRSMRYDLEAVCNFVPVLHVPRVWQYNQPDACSLLRACQLYQMLLSSYAMARYVPCRFRCDDLCRL